MPSLLFRSTKLTFFFTDWLNDQRPIKKQLTKTAIRLKNILQANHIPLAFGSTTCTRFEGKLGNPLKPRLPRALGRWEGLGWPKKNGKEISRNYVGEISHYEAMSKRNSKSGKSSPQRTISGGWQSAASLESSPSSCCTESQRRSTWKRRSIISISSHFPPDCRCLWLKTLSLGPRQVHFEFGLMWKGLHFCLGSFISISNFASSVPLINTMSVKWVDRQNTLAQKDK